MINKLEFRSMGAAIAVLSACTTIAISPIYSYDAFSAIKLIFISALGFISGFFIIINVKYLWLKLRKYEVLILVALLLNALVIFIFGDLNLSQAFYGVSGRYTGFLAYTSLIVILFASATVSTHFVRKKILNSLIFCGVISIFYSLYQFSGRDIVNWDSSAGSRVIGFLGNPNFISAFVALIATAVLSKFLSGKKNWIENCLYLIIIIGSVIVLIGANATQGFLIILLGFTIVLYFYSRFKFKSKMPSRLIFFGSVLGILGGLLDILQKSPWDPFLYGETISIRGDYWRAGWNMALANPVIGVGFDGFLNHYRRSRDIVASTRLGSDIPTDAAHNVFLDYASNGGLIFFLLNLVLIGLILKSGIDYIQKKEIFDANFVAIFAVWVGFTVQSVISINQLGLAIWGWVFGGLILGTKLEAEKFSVENSNIASHKNKKNVIGFTNIATVIVFVIGLLVALPVLVADHKFKQAIDSKKALDLYNSADSWPPITKKMVLVTAVLDQNKIYKEAKILSIKTLQINPDSYEGWIIYAHNPLVSELEMQEIKKQLIRLDPNILKLGGIDKYLKEKIESMDKPK